MNIIKLKDKIMPNEENDEKITFFNEKLKGKYAFWIRMRYIVSFDSFDEVSSSEIDVYTGYVRCEDDINRLIENAGIKPWPWGVQYWDIYDKRILDYIDREETDRINNVQPYILYNKYTTDPDITTEDVKRFRTWLAEELLKFDTDTQGHINNNIFSLDESHVLEYYKNNMSDSIINWLGPDHFGNFPIEMTTESKGCGCCGTSNLSSLYNTTISTCDPLLIYRKNIYNKMVEMFSSIDFWNRKDKSTGEYYFSRSKDGSETGFLNTFKKYIDNIISLNLPLGTSNFASSEFVDCTCVQKDSQNENINILRRLSQSLDFIIKDEMTSHKNFIADSLKEWSSLLYENMYWI